MLRAQAFVFSTFLLLAFVMTLAMAPEAKPRIALEVITRKGVPAAASHDWYQKLTDLGIDGLRIRSGADDEKPSIETAGSDAAPSYKVVGILAADGLLHLPGGTFSKNESSKLRQWLDKLGDQGSEGVTETPKAFGLSARQLELVNQALAAPLPRATKGQTAAQVVAQIGKQVTLPLVVSPAAKKALANVTLQDELQGISAGTALSAALRPAGLALEPRRSGRDVQLLVDTPSKGEYWPVGWKPKDGPLKSAPGLFEFVNVEISETPVAETVEAIAGRLKLPVLYDRNALARHKIDPAKAQGDMPGKKLAYNQVLNRVLAQAGLKLELRVDEADRPFLWVTSIKK